MTGIDNERRWAQAAVQSGQEWTDSLLDAQGRPAEDYWGLASEANQRVESEIYAVDRVQSHMQEMGARGDDIHEQQLRLEETKQTLNDAREEHRKAVLKRMRADELLDEQRWREQSDAQSA